MRNIPNAIVMIGCLLTSVVALIKQVDNHLFWMGICVAYGIAFLTWTRLDSNTNEQQKALGIEEAKLKNKKLNIEIKKLEKETELMK